MRGQLHKTGSSDAAGEQQPLQINMVRRSYSTDRHSLAPITHIPDRSTRKDYRNTLAHLVINNHHDALSTGGRHALTYASGLTKHLHALLVEFHWYLGANAKRDSAWTCNCVSRYPVHFKAMLGLDVCSTNWSIQLLGGGEPPVPRQDFFFNKVITRTFHDSSVTSGGGLFVTTLPTFITVPTW